MATKNGFSFMLTTLFCFIIGIHICHGADTMSKNQSISGDETIVSSNGTFVLGFFSPGSSSNYYIGIWYNKIREQTVVWVANRETPITDKYSSHLKFVDGNLVLVDKSHATVWSSNTNFTSTNLVAVLLDDGNFVLKDSYRSNSKLWQSFDNPTHTWLPGAKLVYDKRTKTSQRLISWKNSEDPAPGMYSMELDSKGNQYVILRNRSVQIWASGEWDESLHSFSLVPEMIKGSLYSDLEKANNFNMSFVSNINESYFTYSLKNASLFMTREVMHYTGQVEQFIWLDNEQKWNLLWAAPKSQCDVSGYCGTYGVCSLTSTPFCNCLSGFRSRSRKSWDLMDYSGGCVRNIELECGSQWRTQVGLGGGPGPPQISAA